MQWFRFYAETLNDPKIQTLPDASFKAWVNALCLAGSVDSRDGNIGTLESVSFAFRETIGTVSSAFHPLLERGLIVTVGETFQISKWGKRQYKSDNSTERVKRFRKRSRNVTETAPDTEQNRTESDTEQKEYPPIPPSPELLLETETSGKATRHDQPRPKPRRLRARLPAAFVPDDFAPDIATLRTAAELGIDATGELREFIDYWKGRGEARCDWQATFRNHLRRSAKYRAERSQRKADGRQNVRDVTSAALRVIAVHNNGKA